jgi:hypothetical protein
LANEPVRIFPHRKNDNGTFDSICPICYRTVATASEESQLKAGEREHVCGEDDFLPPFPEFEDQE